MAERMRGTSWRRAIVGLLAAALVAHGLRAQTSSTDAALDAGDRAWERRHEGRVGARASAAPIAEAISKYGEAARSPDSVEARWKLARALFFQANYTGLSRTERMARLDRARSVSEEAIEILRRRPESVLASDRDDAAAYFWGAVAWGEWALAAGRVRAARAGAPKKIRDYATAVIRIDPRFEEGGGYRILGRLHDRAPRIPFVTGWVSDSEALRNLRLAVRTAPGNFVNRHFLAEALARAGREGRREAIGLARALADDDPTPDHLVEDLAIQEEAKRNLLAWTGPS